MDNEVAERMKVQSQMLANSKEDGTCGAFKVFTLGSNGTAYVACGLRENHWEPSADDVGVTWPLHQAQQGKPDGELIIFRWPL